MRKVAANNESLSLLGRQFLNMLEKNGNKIHIVDPRTHELLYANAEGVEMRFNGQDPDYTGKQCYKYIHGLDEPCEGCPLEHLPVGDGITTRKVYNEQNQTWDKVTAFWVQWHGRKALAFVHFDTTAAEKLAREEEDKIKIYRKSVSEVLSNNPLSISSFHFNITKNICDPGLVKNEAVRRALVAPTMDGFIAKFLKIIPDAKQRRMVRDLINREHLQQMFAAGTTNFTYECQCQSTEARLIWTRTFGNMFKNPVTGDLEGASYSIDIDKEKKWQQIVDSLVGQEFDFIALLDLHTGKVTEYSDKGKSYFASTRIKEISYTQAVENALHKIIRPDEAAAAIKVSSIKNIQTQLAREKIYWVAFPTKDGQDMAWRFNYLQGDPNCILIARKDVTEIHAVERRHLEEVRKAQRAAEQANNAKTEFLNRMSHDMRTPLNGIIGSVYLAKEKVISKETAAYLDDIDVSSKFLLSLINDTLDISKIESGTMELRPEPISIETIKAYLAAVVKPFIASSNQKFISEISMTPGYLVVTDRMRISRIFFNLLRNASKYTPEGGTIKLIVRYDLVPGTKKMAGHGEIIDNGIGMSKAFQKVMFEPFTQEHRQENKPGNGYGLGLPIVKRIVEAIHGKIRVESEPGKGTRIIIDTVHDCISEADNQAQQLQKAASVDDAKFKGKHILVCEDHPLNQKIIKALLQDKGMYVDLAEDGQRGLQQFIISPLYHYDAILMDIRMPLMDGYEATSQIRALPRGDAAVVPIIALSANAFEHDVAISHASGMNDHLSKPIEPNTLYATLAKYLK
ncbi:MAG: response regulator [Acidaminococcaceae bacterium]|nr:response regulator [Acidaminococcaceae bacterium]